MKRSATEEQHLFTPKLKYMTTSREFNRETSIIEDSLQYRGRIQSENCHQYQNKTTTRFSGKLGTECRSNGRNDNMSTRRTMTERYNNAEQPSQQQRKYLILMKLKISGQKF